MNTAAWIVSGLLAALYVTGGFTKLTQPITKLRSQMGWVDDIPFGLVRFIGASELLGAAGLILPKLLDVIDDRGGVEGTLTGVAAAGLALIQVLAVPVHLRRRELGFLPLNLALALGAAFVAAARFGWF